jgi:hypothetical protein
MRHLAGTGDIPAIFMVQGMAYFAFHHTAGIVSFYFFQAVWTAMFLVNCQLNLRLSL